MHCNMRFNLERTAQAMTQLPISRRAGVARVLVAALALLILPAWAACAAGEDGRAAPAVTVRIGCGSVRRANCQCNPHGDRGGNRYRYYQADGCAAGRR